MKILKDELSLSVQVLVAIVAMILVFPSTGYAELRSEFQSINTYTEGSAFVVDLVFDKPIEANKVTVEYINRTIQLNIPDAFVKSGKNLYRVRNNKKVKSVYSYQVRPQCFFSISNYSQQADKSKTT